MLDTCVNKISKGRNPFRRYWVRINLSLSLYVLYLGFITFKVDPLGLVYLLFSTIATLINRGTDK